MGIQSVQDDLGEDLASNAQKGNTIVVVAAGFVTVAFVQMHYSSICQIMG